MRRLPAALHMRKPRTRPAALLLLLAACAGGDTRAADGDTADSGAGGAGGAASAGAAVGAAPADASPAEITVTLTGSKGNDGTYTATGAEGACLYMAEGPQGQPRWTASWSDDAHPQVKWVNATLSGSLGRDGGTAGETWAQIGAGTAGGPGEADTGMETIMRGSGTGRVTAEGRRMRIEVEGTTDHGTRARIVVRCTPAPI